jgi:hypothetical protein
LVTVSKRMRVTALLLMLFATAGAVAACGSSSKSRAGGTPTAPAGQNAFAAYTECLRKNGVILPSAFPRGNRPSGRPANRPTGRPTARPTARPSGARGGGGFGFGDQPPAGVDAQTWQKAQQACASVRPSGGARNRDNGALRAYRNCLSDHGVTMTGAPGALDATDPKIAAALKACDVLRPSTLPTPAPTS